MKKQLIITSLILSAGTIYATDYVSIIQSEQVSYVVDTPWKDKGAPYDCSLSPLASDIRHGLSFNQTETCKQDQIKSKNGVEENQTITVTSSRTEIGTLYSKSCLEELNGGYSTGDGVYSIEYSGEVVSVYCDMTTDGGGWTNVNRKIGSQGALTGYNGISETATSDQLINAPLVSSYNTDCSDNSVVTEFGQDFFDTFPFTEIKIESKSYGGGDTRCGGVLRRSSFDVNNLVKFNSFNTGALWRCDNDQIHGGPGRGFSEERNQAYLHFKYDRIQAGNPGWDNRSVASVSASCSSGTGYLQLKSIMVR
jgi:hypothetical protein